MDDTPRKWKAPNTDSKCTYHDAQSRNESPHVHSNFATKAPICDSILDSIGQTPLVRLNKIPRSEGITCEVLAKCEYFNPGGSVKDRVGVRMVEAAERSGLIKPGDTLIEPTAGNTGIGIAMAAAVKGYRCILVIPEKMSMEKVDILRALGADVIRTPTSASFDTPESHFSVAKRLLEEIPRSHILDQFGNANNPLAHYDGTAEEILAACNGKVDMLVAGVGTGGTLTGSAKKIKEHCPNCKIIGVDPVGSMIAEPGDLNEGAAGTMYDIEDIGADFIPTTCDTSIVDRWYKSVDKPSFLMSRRLIREEGLLCGGSSGAMMYCAIQAMKDYGLTEGHRCVVIIPDTVRNYMSKFLSDDWMDQKQFLHSHEENPPENWWWKVKVRRLALHSPVTVGHTVTVGETIDLLTMEGSDHAPVLDECGTVIGIITIGNLRSKLDRNRIKMTDHTAKVIYTQFKTVDMECTLGELSRLFYSVHYVLVQHRQTHYEGDRKRTETPLICGVLTKRDLLAFISNHRK